MIEEDLRKYLLTDDVVSKATIEPIKLDTVPASGSPTVIITTRGGETVIRGGSLRQADVLFECYGKSFEDDVSPIKGRLIEIFSKFSGDIGKLRVQTSSILLSTNSYDNSEKIDSYVALIEVSLSYTLTTGE